MNIGLLAASISRDAGGLYWAMRAISSELCKRKWCVQVYGAMDSHSDLDLASWGEALATTQHTVGPKSFGYQPGLLAQLNKSDLDILHVHGLWMYPSVAAVRWSQHARPYVVSPHGMLDTWALRNSGWKKKLAGLLYERSHLRGAMCVHALCEAELRAIRSYGLKTPVAVIPNGVDVPEISERPRPPWSRLGLNSGKILLFLGRIHPKKGLEELISAFNRASLTNVDGVEEWNLVIAGWDQGGYQHVLQRQVAQLGLERKIHFTGPVFGDDKAACFLNSSAFALPSFSEGLPVAVLEAWSYGLPALISHACNLPAGFRSGAAIPVDPTIPSILAGLVQLFGMKGADLIEMGGRGRSLVEAEFTWEKIGASMDETYRWILGGGSKPSSVDGEVGK